MIIGNFYISIYSPVYRTIESTYTIFFFLYFEDISREAKCIKRSIDFYSATATTLLRLLKSLLPRLTAKNFLLSPFALQINKKKKHLNT